MSHQPSFAPAGARDSRCVALVIVVLFLITTTVPAQNSGAANWLPQARSITTPSYVQAAPASSAGPGRSAGGNSPAASPAQVLSSGQAHALSLISGDFNGDGIADLAAGYSAPGGGGIVAVHFGSLDALAPQSYAGFQAVARGEFAAPFLPDVPVFSVPAAPDFLAVGNFTGSGNNDLAVAARGASVLYLIPGDGHGNFGAPQTVNLAGRVTALAAGRLGHTSRFADLIVGVSGPDSSSLLVYQGAPKALQLVASYALAKPVSSIALGNLTGGAGADAAVSASGDLFVLTSAMQLEQVALPVAANTVTVGSFIYDRGGRQQMALLSPDGALHIVGRAGTNSRALTPAERKAVFLAAAHGLPNPLVSAPNANEGWRLLESFALTAAGPSSVLLPTRISSNAADDIVVLNGFSGQMAVVSHRNLREGAVTFSRGVVSVHPYTGSPVAAVSMHLSVDSRPELVTLHQGDNAPAVLALLPGRVFNVNTTSDIVAPNACAGNVANSCSLREAILEANAGKVNDIINVPAGTYTLTLTGPSKEIAGATAAYGSLDIFHGLTINGAVDGSGNPATIIQAGTDSTNGIDSVFAVNPNAAPGFDTQFSNLVVRFGKNSGSFTGGPASVIPRGFGGGVFWEGGQTGSLTVVNSIITDNSTLDGNGGGIAADNAALGATGAATGALNLIKSTVQNNSVQQSSTNAPGVGGGIWAAGGTPIVISGSQILNNQAAQTVDAVGGQGGGIFLAQPGNSNTDSAIHGTVISGNKAAGQGGGVFTAQGLIVDNAGAAMELSNNQADQGGGLWSGAGNGTTVLSKVTITGNTATGSDAANCSDSCGGGVFAASPGADSSHLVMHFSRLAGNTAASGSNLANLGTAASTDDVTNNWWGLNQAADTIHDASGAVGFDPMIVFTHTASPAKIRTHQSSTLTGDISSDNHGNSDALTGNLDVFSSLPIQFHNSVLGTVSTPRSAASLTGTQTTATYNAGSTGGKGSVDATVDQQTVTASITVTPTAPTAMPPTISKLFLPDTIVQNGTTLLSFTITNPNSDPKPAITLTGVQFTDALPAGLQVANAPTLLNNDCGGTLTAAPGSASISLTGGTIAPAVPLLPPPLLHRRFSAARLTSLLPFSATGACFISVPVTAPSAGVFANTTGVISANESGPGATSNTATLTVTAAPIVVPPTATKAFGDVAIPPNGTTSLTFTVTNPNTTTELVNVGLADLLPSGLVVANPNGLTGSCILTDGTVIANPGTGSITLAALSLLGTNSCSFSVNVTGTTSGVKNNVTGNITATYDNGSGTSVAISGGPASATVTVLLPPVIVKAFSPTLIAPTGVSTLSFTITNPAANPIPLTGVGFTDTLPANLFVATPSGASGSCNGGTLTAVDGSGTISLTGGTIPAGGSCTVSANVTSAVTGTYVNTVTVTSTSAGTGNTATATLTVGRPDLSITKTHKCDFHRRQKGATYTITVSNSASAGPTLGTVTVTDTLPPVKHTLVPTAIGGTGWTCTLATLTCTRNDSLAPGASYPPITLTVNVPRNIRANVVNTATVSGGSDLNSHTAKDPTHVGPPRDPDDDHGDGADRDHDCRLCRDDDGDCHDRKDDHHFNWFGRGHR